MSAVDVILLILAIAACVPIAVLAIETFAAVWPRRPRVIDRSGTRSSAVVLIPAHNEAAGIRDTISAIRPQLAPGDRVIVIADNCSDATAAVAREAGAESIERHDVDRRGKGFALQFGIDHLRERPPAVVVLIDADTRAGTSAVEALIREVQAHDCPVQGVFTDSPKSRSPREQWSAFALKFKNYVRPLGLHRMGMPTLLFGSGMAFPWKAISSIEMGTGNIVEDMKLGIDLAVAGHLARYCPDARFESDDAPSIEATTKRRTRWEHGHVMTLLTQSPRLLWAGLRRMRLRLWALAFELAVPPLSLLMLAALALWAVCLGWREAGGSGLPWTILTVGGLAAVATILTAWAVFGRRLLSPKILCLLPVYVLWKVPIYLKLLVAPQRNWVRTDRKPAA